MTTETGLNRRQLGAGILGLSFTALGAGGARAQQGGPFNVFAHRVMQTVSTGAQGGDITKDWAAKNGVGVQWTTFDTGPLQERLFREASLGETSVDVGFVLNTQVVPRAANLFEALDDYLKRDPLEDPADIFPGLMQGMTVGGKQLAVPFRHASSGLHYNEEILAEKGFSKPPATIEEMIEIARACSYRRSDGTQVVGLCMPGVTYPNVIALLDEMTAIAATMESEAASSNYRFGASRAYDSIVGQRLEAIDEAPYGGWPTLAAFLSRRMAPAMRTCQMLQQRQLDLSRRLARAANLLRTRVDVALEQQNRDLLSAMNDRTRLQLRLQQTVEGLSVAAIAYYVVSLFGYLAKGAKDAGHLPIDVGIATALFVPVAILGVWLMVRRIRHGHRDG